MRRLLKPALAILVIAAAVALLVALSGIRVFPGGASANGSAALAPGGTPVNPAPAPQVVPTTTPPAPTVFPVPSTTIARLTADELTPVKTVVTAPTPPFPMPAGPAQDDPYPISPATLADRVHELINEQRVTGGLPALSSDPALTDIAENHSADMAANNYFSHVSPSGQTPTDRGTAAGYTCRKEYGSYYTYGIAENIFQNNLYTTVTYYSNGTYVYDWNSQEQIAQTTVGGWMNSTGHRKNILTPTYDREGIGVAISSDDKVYITEDFC